MRSSQQTPGFFLKIIKQQCGALNLWKCGYSTMQPIKAENCCWKIKTSLQMGNKARTSWSNMTPLCNSTNTKTSHLGQTFSYWPSHRNSVNCNVTSMSQPKIRRDLIKVKPQHRGVRVWEEKRIEEFFLNFESFKIWKF